MHASHLSVKYSFVILCSQQSVWFCFPPLLPCPWVLLSAPILLFHAFSWFIFTGLKCTRAVSSTPAGTPEASWMIFHHISKSTVSPHPVVFSPYLPPSLSPALPPSFCSPVKNGSTTCTAITCQLCTKTKDYWFLLYLLFFLQLSVSFESPFSGVSFCRIIITAYSYLNS